jgi:23S rRNA (pseudouridine1915-N3)-methyltransferase
MRLRILWPGKTRNRDIQNLQEFYLGRINQLEKCEIIETKTSKGIPERFAQKIKEIEASGLEKHFENHYIICLFHEGKDMSSVELAQFLKTVSSSSAQVVTFVVGGFLGLEERILKRADALLSLSRMTFSHELSRVMLLEQIYRALMIIKGRQYAK